MSSAYKVITPPISEPIAVADAKAFLRIDYADEDTLIQSLITRARATAETITHRALAPQIIQCRYTIERPTGGEMYGPINEGPNWYAYQEQLGANPFGAAMFYFDLPMPPIQVNQTFTVQTRVTVWDQFEPFTGLYTIDDVQEPARVYFQVPVTANQWDFTYTAGYSSSYPVPPEIVEPMYELIVYWFENRDAPDYPQAIKDKLLAKRVDWI